jgi:phage I-like protein
MLARDTYIAKMEARLMGWADEVAWLRSKAALVATQGSTEFQQHLETSHAEHRAVRHKLEGLKKSGGDRWNALAACVEGAWKGLTA